MSIERPMKKVMPTIYDVASKAGTSIATVSRVINRPDKVSASTREKIFQAMEDLGFTPKAEARERARREVGRIGVLTPYFTYPSFVHRLRGISEALRGSAYELVIINLDKKEDIENYLRSPGLSHRIDGLIILSSRFDKSTLKIIEEQSIHTVFVEFGEDSFSSVCIDNYKGGEMAARFLIDRGYKSFGILTENELGIKVHPNMMRLTGFQKYMEKNYYIIPEERVVYGGNKMPEAIAGAERLLSIPFIEAIFATTDFLAVAVMKAAKKKGIAIPEDLGLIGFDGTNTSDYMDLTTVDQALEESGRLSVELLMKRIRNPESPVQTIYLPLKIIERDTTTS